MEKEQIKSVVIGFSSYKRDSWMTKLIKIFDNKTYTHVYIRFEGLSGEVLMYHAMIDEKPILRFEDFKKDNHIIKEYFIEAPQQKIKDIMSFCYEEAKKPYSLMKLVGIAGAKILKKTKNPFWHKKDAHICTEFASEVMRRLGLSINEDLLSTSGPSYLDQVLEALNKEGRHVG